MAADPEHSTRSLWPRQTRNQTDPRVWTLARSPSHRPAWSTSEGEHMRRDSDSKSGAIWGPASSQVEMHSLRSHRSVQRQVYEGWSLQHCFKKQGREGKHVGATLAGLMIGPQTRMRASYAAERSPRGKMCS